MHRIKGYLRRGEQRFDILPGRTDGHQCEDLSLSQTADRGGWTPGGLSIGRKRPDAGQWRSPVDGNGHPRGDADGHGRGIYRNRNQEDGCHEWDAEEVIGLRLRNIALACQDKSH